MYYTTLAWPAVAKSYYLTRYNAVTSQTTVLDEAYQKPFLGYEAPETDPCLILVHPLLGKDGDLKGKPYTFAINEPPSLATLRWMIRAALNDTDVETGIDYKYPENPKWADRELDGYVRECLGLFNTFLPRERKIQRHVTQLTRAEIGLTADESIKGVAYESKVVSRNGEFILMNRSSRRMRQQREPLWDLDDQGELRIMHLDLYGLGQIELSITGHYVLPQNDFTAIDLPREHWEILSIFGQGKAHLRLAGQSAQLDRWKETGIRSDNPITPIARRLLSEAMERITGMKGPVGMRRVRA